MRFKLGRIQPQVRPPMLRLSNYLLRKLPPAPPSADYTSKARGFLGNVLGNATCGDCTVAGAFHIAGCLLANANRPIPFSALDAITLYRQLSGWNGIPDDPSDAGLDETQVLNYWTLNGLSPGGHTIDGYVQVHGRDIEECKSAIWLFENLYIGVSMPQAWIDSMQTIENGFVWNTDGPGLPEAGHCFCAVGYTADGIIIVTWGLLGPNDVGGGSDVCR